MKRREAEQAKSAQAAASGGAETPQAASGGAEAPQAVATKPAPTGADIVAGVVPGVTMPSLQVGQPTVAPTNGYSEVLQAHHDRGGLIAEQYRAIRTALLAQYPDRRFCLMVTSSDEGEGKTVTTLNTAIMLAERRDSSVIVVDSDLRKGQVANLLHGKTHLGLADVLRGKAKLKDVIQPTVYPNFSFVPGGRVSAEEVSELLSRPEMGEIIAELRQAYDCVLVDTPTVAFVADTGVLGHAVNQALMVVRMNKTSRDSVDRAVRLLRAANVTVVGMVLTHQQYHVPNYLYKYS
jgi:capsular exopolysaccharide synthesis family protein